MTYEQIIQQVGKRIEPKIYYNNGTRAIVTIDRDDIKLIRPHFETNIIGTIMRGTEVELTVQLPPNTKIYVGNTASFGLDSATKEFGAFNIQDETYNADTRTYTYNLYDEMLNLMVEYKGIGSYAYVGTNDTIFIEDKKYYYELANDEYVEYDGDRSGNPSQLLLYESAFPMSLNEYLGKILITKSYLKDISNLPNGDRQVNSDIYEGLDFTYRDVLDDIGQACGVLFKMGDDRALRICEKGTTPKVIDDDILMNQNISMGEHYGPINTIVLSRSSGTDNVYYPDPLPVNPIEFKIEDNQLMNGDDRSDYLPALYNQLNGLEYDIYDCELTGFGGFEPLDKVQINTIENNTTKTYNSYVFNNDIKITGGYDESIYNELPQKAATNFKYASPTDKAIKNAEIIVDKKISEVNIKGKTINLTADNIKIESDNFGVDEEGNIRANGGTIGGYEISEDSDNIRYLKAETYPKYNYTQADYDELIQLILSGDTPTQEQLDKYDFYNNGVLTVTDVYYLVMLLDNEVDLTHPVYIKLSSAPGKIFESALEFIVGTKTRFKADYNQVTINDGAARGETTLFEDTNGDNGSIQLNNIPDDYLYTEIYAIDNTGHKGIYIKINNLVDGDVFTLSSVDATSTTTITRRTKYTVSGDTLIPSNGGYTTVSGSSISSNLGTNYIYITKVVGWK